jgi:RND family efflux transporter MFP subunit
MNCRVKEYAGAAALALLAAGAVGCSRNGKASVTNTPPAVPVGVATVRRMPLARQLTLSSELVPFQEIDVYAKESGYVKDLNVDFGTHVRKGQLMAVLEIPELELQLKQDQADIQSRADQVNHARRELSRVQAQHKVIDLQYHRLNTVAEAKPGLVAQQEVDDWEGKDLASEAQVEASDAALQAAQGDLAVAQARLARDQALYDYSRITAPFAGVVTERYANLGALMQAGTSSSTQAMPLVKLSEDDLFRLVIPVPESYVQYIKIGDPVEVKVNALNRTFPGKVARFSVDVKEDTRTMHTEVDVANPEHVLIPGMYAEATLVLDRKNDALTVPLQAVGYQNGHARIFVVDSGGKLDVRPVNLGIQTANNVEVLSGVLEGDQVVVGDRGGLKAGELVRPQLVPASNYQEQEQ